MSLTSGKNVAMKLGDFLKLIYLQLSAFKATVNPWLTLQTQWTPLVEPLNYINSCHLVISDTRMYMYQASKDDQIQIAVIIKQWKMMMISNG